MNKKFLGIILAIAAFGALVAFLKLSPGIAPFLWQWSGEGKFLAPLVVVAAAVDSINPCAFSVLLLTIAFLFSLGKMRSSILKIGGVYILGIFVAYLLIGLGILQALHVFSVPHFMAKVGATLLILLGFIGIINEFFPSFPIRLTIPTLSHRTIAGLMEKASIPTAFILGALVGLCEFPCTGGPYLLILGLLHDQGTYWSGLGYLVFYNLIFVLPLVLILLGASNRAVLDKIQEWRKNNIRKFHLWGAVVVIILGMLTFLI
ncbi:MAG: cytochrome c biogenesis protein CcdA [Patescibacteria group bacterium]|mgnify:CR=1 FL=1